MINKTYNLNMSIDQIISAFNQISRVVTFENDLNAISTMVYNLQNNHINKKDIFAMNNTVFIKIKPEAISAKYQITRSKLSRLLIFLYKTDSEDHGIATFEYPQIFSDDVESSYIFVPEFSLSPNSPVNVHWFTVMKIFEELFHYTGTNNSGGTLEDYFIETVSDVFTNILLTCDEFKPSQDKQDLLNAIKDSVIIGSYGAPEISLADNAENGELTRDDFRFEIEKLARSSYYNYYETKCKKEDYE